MYAQHAGIPILTVRQVTMDTIAWQRIRNQDLRVQSAVLLDLALLVPKVNHAASRRAFLIRFSIAVRIITQITIAQQILLRCFLLHAW
jgi:hypothetical protein